MKYLAGLNEAQKSAVLETEGPVLVLAGAGAGKTKTIAHRILHLVNSGIPHYRILAITFTNKAAREMRDRVTLLLREHGKDAHEPLISTFHALSVRILREHAELCGIPRSFTIFDRADSLRAMKRAITRAGEDPGRFDAKVLLHAVSRAKSEGHTAASFRDSSRNEYFGTVVADVWDQYDVLVRNEGALDYDDLVLCAFRLLHDTADVRNRLHERWRYVHVDEYQDTNKVQYDFIHALTAPDHNLFCVGDLDQNVYTWRGSTTENVLAFERNFPDAAVHKLEQNYRSTQTIIAVSNAVIQKNVNRKDKSLFTENEKGEPILIMSASDERDEALRVVHRVQELLVRGVSPHEIAILYRANFQSRVLEEACLQAGIPYRVLGTRFFDRKEVKDVLSYIRAARNRSSESDLRRIMNDPVRGIGKVTMEKVLGGQVDTLTPAARAKVDAFFAILDDVRDHAERFPPSQVVSFTLKRSGIETLLQNGSEEGRERLENVQELVSLASTRYDVLHQDEGIARLLEDAALASDQDDMDYGARERGVLLMTVHAAKGLEFEHVFITGLEDTLFPHERRDTHSSANSDPEEERRLFYVALTRAKKRLYLSYAHVRTVFGSRLMRIPSDFLQDITAEYAVVEGEEGSDSATRKVVYLE